MANVMRNRGVAKGDRVTIYMPMIPEAAYAMLACARIGAIHSVVFGGFSPDSLASRISDAKSAFIITADEGLRGGRKVPLKVNVDAAIERVGNVDHVLVVRRTGTPVNMVPGRDVYYDEAAEMVTGECPVEEMNAEDPLFLLYTSGSTGQPKGVLHTTGGYLVHVASTHQYVFDYHDGDIYWCTADVGWVTGHSLYSLRTARQRRHHADVRGRADLSVDLPLLGSDRQAQRQHLLHRADRHPLPSCRRARSR